jgi:hypothetical protein
MFATFDADLDRIERDTGSLLPWSTTVSTKYADSSAVYRWNVSRITQELSTLVWLLEHTMENNHWFNAHRQHKGLLIQLVLKPAENLKIQVDYALEILYAFSRNRGKDESIDYSTVFDIWKPKNSANLPAENYRMLELSDTQALHASSLRR